MYYRMGVRYMILIYSCDVEWQVCEFELVFIVYFKNIFVMVLVCIM